jgi:rhodanese-related sulfurtransferase
MKAEQKRQKQEERIQEKKQQRLYAIIGAVVALAVIGVAAAAFTPRAGTSSGTSTAADTFRRITATELKALVDQNQVTIIDVRTAEQYIASHIPGALQIPVSRVDGEVPYLPRDKTIVTYCTCPAEESSGQAVQILAHRGITNAAALHGGMGAWEKAGYRLTSGAEPGAP